MCLGNLKYQQPMTALETILYKYFCNILADLVLYGSKVLDVLNTTFTFAKTFEQNDGLRFNVSKEEDSGAASKASNRLPGARMATE